jgi:type II secretory pathway component PulK
MTYKQRAPSACETGAQDRHGHALVITAIVLTLATALAVGLVHGLLADSQQYHRQLLRMQAELVAESVLQEAAQRLQRDPDYAGELRTLDVPGAEFGPANVQIEVTADELRAVVQLPTDAPPQDQVRLELGRPRGTP